MALPSVMSKKFSQIPPPQIQRSVFNRTHGHKTTFDAGYLYPIFVDEILPGDTMALKANIFARLLTLEFPIMDNIFIDTHWFFVPNRLVWTNWERFQGAQDDPGDSTDFLIPILDMENGEEFASLTLHDYFGLPVGVGMDSDDAPIALPYRAYWLIWNQWFRDQNMQDSLVIPLGDGPDPYAAYNVPLRRGKRHDYFTSVLPEPQKGDAISIPMGTTAPVVGTGQVLGLYSGTQTFGLATETGQPQPVISTAMYGDDVGFAYSIGNPTNNVGLGVTQSAVNSGLVADLSSAVAATINDLREAFAFQQILELDARGGTRYVESLKAMWGVDAGDYRLQRPEYLGGSSDRLSVNSVPQTTPSEGSNAQGNLAAYAQVGAKPRFSKSFVEHGFVIGLISARADITYQQGMRRMWSRRTRFDLYQPPLAHLGEQAVLNKEIYYKDVAEIDPANNEPFGYQERWADYRYFPSMVTGQFRSNPTAPFTSLDAWHLALNFLDTPLLNADFIVDNPPISRVVALNATANSNQFLMDSYIEVKHARPMPVYSVPGLQRL